MLLCVAVTKTAGEAPRITHQLPCKLRRLFQETMEPCDTEREREKERSICKSSLGTKGGGNPHILKIIAKQPQARSHKTRLGNVSVWNPSVNWNASFFNQWGEHPIHHKLITHRCFLMKMDYRWDTDLSTGGFCSDFYALETSDSPKSQILIFQSLWHLGWGLMLRGYPHTWDDCTASTRHLF